MNGYQRLAAVAALGWSFIAGLAIGGSAARAATPIPIEAPQIPTPVIERIPLKVGLCAMPNLRTAVIVLDKKEAVLESLDSTGPDRKAWALGDAVLATLEATLRAQFDEVKVLQTCPPEPRASGELQGIVTAELEDAGALISPRSFLGIPVRENGAGHVDLRLSLHSADGAAVATWRIVGRPFLDAAGSQKGDAVATTFRAALRNASARFLVDVSVNPQFHSWLTSNDIREEAAHGAPSPEDGESVPKPADLGKIAILGNGLDSRPAHWTLPCLSKALARVGKDVRIITEEQARDVLFPWLEPGVLSAQSADTVAGVLAGRMIHERASAADLQFLVLPTAARSNTDMRGPFFCGAAGEGAGCLGVATLKRESAIGATLWDLRRGLQVPSVSGKGRAHDVLIGFVLPVWIPAGPSSKSLACRDMANALAGVIHGDPNALLTPIAAAPNARVPVEIGTTEETTSVEESEIGTTYAHARWFADTEDLGSLGEARVLQGGERGTLRVTDHALTFRAYCCTTSAHNLEQIRIPYDEISSVQYRTTKLRGSFFRHVSSVVVTRKSGEVDSLFIVRHILPGAEETASVARILQSKAGAHAADTSPPEAAVAAPIPQVASSPH